MNNVRATSNQLLLEDLNAKVDYLTKLLHRVVRKMYPEEAQILKPLWMPRLPLKTEKEFKNFDKYLGDELNFSAVVSFIFLYGVVLQHI